MYAIIGIRRPNVCVVDLGTNEEDLCSFRLLQKLSIYPEIVGVEDIVIRVTKPEIIIEKLKSEYAVMGIPFPFKITTKSDGVHLEQCLDKDIVNAVVPYGVTFIEAQAFDCCSALQTVAFPSSLRRIGESAFDSNYLLNLRLLEGIICINKEAFAGSLFIENLVFPSTLEFLAEGCFARCLALKYVDLSKTKATLGSSVFSSCTALVDVELPQTLEKLNKDCFYNCTELEHIVLPNTLLEIGKSCFEKCLSLTDIEIPERVTKIGSRAFYNCDNLRKVRIPETVVDIADDAFGADAFFICRAGDREDFDFIIECKEGSAADRFALEHGYTIEYY